ncbi:MAG: GNAT family N-acetyltransferase [Breznakibacter sp.]
MRNSELNNLHVEEGLPEIDGYFDLFETTGWNDGYKFTKKELEQAIGNSWYSISVYRSGTLIGFGRIISDGVHHAFIVDLIIHPDFQGKRIGSEILDRLVKKCKDSKIRDIQLFSAKGKFGFYEKLGFEKRPGNAPGMELNC